MLNDGQCKIRGNVNISEFSTQPIRYPLVFGIRFNNYGARFSIILINFWVPNSTPYICKGHPHLMFFGPILFL